ncbi:Negative regulator of phenolic acid metabolism PadR [Lachnospiraceae bacterium TWA4]|nr:Negative regulator of phenolic acid metabolism PadR [Lachnospiraceae bacterium TWA4]
MRVLKFAILGLLNQQKMTGYELMKQFESTLCEFWSAKHSQIYPELKKLTDEGCLEYEVEISGTSLEKKIYSITKKGKDEFLVWLHSETILEATPKDISRLKIFFSSSLSQMNEFYYLKDQKRQHKERLEHLKNNQKKFTKIPASDSDEFGDYLVLKGAIMREQMTIQWLQECIELCN